MSDNTLLSDREIRTKLTRIRNQILLSYPFYGSLLMRMRFSLADCETACTDMKRILWDRAFISRLGDQEAEFVMLHEILHCCLLHCLRGQGMIDDWYNIAADIVVNSNILSAMGLGEFIVDGSPVMHLAPDGKEGREYTAEQVYEQILKHAREQLVCANYDGWLDSHSIWKEIRHTELMQELWKESMRQAAKQAGNATPSLIRQILDIEEKGQLDWRKILQEYIRVHFERFDYSFLPTDRRFSDSDFLMPAFNEMETEKVENIWFVADTSGSISDEMLTQMFIEIREALDQFEHLSGLLSFFDVKVTEPVLFESVDELLDMKPIGRGGTSFHAIFEYMKEHMIEKLPTAVIILTDGCASFPEEEAALGVPVLWIILGSEKEVPWGEYVNLPDSSVG